MNWTTVQMCDLLLVGLDREFIHDDPFFPKSNRHVESVCLYKRGYVCSELNSS